MARRVEFLEAARQDVLEARAWFETRGVAATFTAELERAIGQISQLPESWPLYSARERRYLFRRLQYSVFYRVQGEIIVVVAVAHERRRPGFWRGR